MARKLKVAGWSMKADRELIRLARSQTLDELADEFQRSPAYILKRAARLGLSIKRKAKGK
jgi:predicted transcriptional regulator